MKAFAALLPVLATANNMNPFDYMIANAPQGHQGKPYPFLGEYFEIRSESIKNKYSQVFWGTIGPTPLPPEIVKRYNGSLMAITGFEVDVMRNVSGKEVPVPCYQSYNHHYQPIIASPYAQFTLHQHGKSVPKNPHGLMKTFSVSGSPPPDVHLAQDFVHGNGNEHRQLYHGIPNGFTQSVYSPDHFLLSAMQINTNDGSGAKGPHGPVPKLSRTNFPADVPFSPLIECPITDRVKKTAGGVNTQVQGTCGKSLDESQCFAALSGLSVVNITKNVTLSNASFPAGCSAVRVGDPASSQSFQAIFNTDSSSTASCQSASPNKDRVKGVARALVGVWLEVDSVSGVATLGLQGPSAVWFGIGLNATMMQDMPYAIIVDGNGNVQERKLMDHDPGKQLASSVTVLSSNVTGGVRTVVLQRPLQGLTPDHYTFSAEQASINFINALGGSVEFAQHVSRSSNQLLMFQMSTDPTCVCASGAGSIDGIPYNPNCKPRPWSDLLAESNPVCDAMTYQGGLASCRGWLLDSDQPIPDFEDEIYFKFRFYFTDYKPAMRDVYHMEWAINGCDSGAFGPNPLACTSIEFDVVKGTNSSGPGVASYKSVFPVRGMLETECTMQSVQCMDMRLATKGVDLVMAASHCHAPNCLRQELINADSGELLCVALPQTGNSENVYDERGYLFAPPCVWGSAEDGFLPPPRLQLDTNLAMIAYYNSSYTHTGQMGIWQMKGAFAQ